MITRAVKIRLVAFLVLSAVGIVYAASSYLGFVDTLLGKGYQLQATLPESGGLYEGGEVTYRGVNIGEIKSMAVDGNGVRMTLAIASDATNIPKDAPMHVYNESAVGEQYLDFEPPNDEGPYFAPGDVARGGPRSMPVTEEALLLDLDEFVFSVNRNNLRTVIAELGNLFRGTGRPLQDLIDNGNKFVDEARENEAPTIALIENGVTVLRTQDAQGGNIRSLAQDLADVTGTIADSDADLRATIEGGSGAAAQMDSLLNGIEPTLPVMLSNMVTVNQVVATRLPALEQTLVTFPRIISSGFSGTPGDGYGHVNLQFDDSPPACRKGYLPPNRWRPGHVVTDSPIYLKAHCASGAPFNMRGSKYAPGYGGGDGGSSARVAPYDPANGYVDPRTGERTGAITVGGQGGQQAVFGEDSWKWMLLGPMESR